LSNREAEIVMEVEKALSLLREEGSSVAMPEAVQQVHDDMQQLVLRLAEGKTEVLTQAIETDVIKGLEEILDALKKAQKNADNKKKPPGPSPNGQPQDPPLIEQLAELKMIRALQMRVNRRTERYSKLIDGEQANKEDVQEALRRLSEQEARVHKVTRDLELGKNE
jgi:cob(I)alamin adenosyltransferase